MTYRRMPLFPPACGSNSALHMPLFDICDPCRERQECQCVRLRNPGCPGEYADVELCVDMDGNLSICVKRPPKPCRPLGYRRHRYDCDCPSCYR